MIAVSERYRGRLFDPDENGGDETPQKSIHAQKETRGEGAGAKRRQRRRRRTQRRPEAPRRAATVEVEHVGEAVLEFALDGVVEREEAVLREQPLLVEPNRPRV